MTQHPDAVPHRTDPAVLELRGVTVSLPHGGDRPNAIEDVSFSVAKGEFLCIVGESGSGKSISGQAVFGLLPRRLLLKGGQALLGGADLLAMPRAQLRRIRGRRIAMIFQEPMTALNPVWTVGNQIEEVFATHTDLSADARRARARHDAAGGTARARADDECLSAPDLGWTAQARDDRDGAVP